MKRMSWQNQRADIENESNVKVTYDQHGFSNMTTAAAICYKRFFF